MPIACPAVLVKKAGEERLLVRRSLGASAKVLRMALLDSFAMRR
jgi:hypothetical protein